MSGFVLFLRTLTEGGAALQLQTQNQTLTLEGNHTLTHLQSSQKTDYYSRHPGVCVYVCKKGKYVNWLHEEKDVGGGTRNRGDVDGR